MRYTNLFGVFSMALISLSSWEGTLARDRITAGLWGDFPVGPM